MSEKAKTGSHTPKGQLPQEVFDRLLEHTATISDRASKLGVALSVAYQNGYAYKQTTGELDIRQIGDDAPVFAASHAKLAVASYELERFPDDEKRVSQISTMLRKSDNDIFAKLKEKSAGDINAYARDQVGLSTDILSIRPDGTSYSGLTTAVDSMKLLVHLLNTAKRLNLRDEISRALAKNTSKYGVRTMLRPHNGVHLLNKTGDYFGAEDSEVGDNVHHDVGVVFTGKNDAGRRLLYSVTTSSPTPGRARVADMLNHQLGAEYIKSVGGKPLRPLGHKAISMFVKSSPSRR